MYQQSAQINLATRMYADDHADAVWTATNNDPIYVTYKDSVQPYLSRVGAGQSNRLFACPSDDFDCDDPNINDLFSFWAGAPSGTSFYRQKITDYSSFF